MSNESPDLGIFQMPPEPSYASQSDVGRQSGPPRYSESTRCMFVPSGRINQKPSKESAHVYVYLPVVESNSMERSGRWLNPIQLPSGAQTGSPYEGLASVGWRLPPPPSFGLAGDPHETTETLTINVT